MSGRRGPAAETEELFLQGFLEICGGEAGSELLSPSPQGPELRMEDDNCRPLLLPWEPLCLTKSPSPNSGNRA